MTETRGSAVPGFVGARSIETVVVSPPDRGSTRSPRARGVQRIIPIRMHARAFPEEVNQAMARCTILAITCDDQLLELLRSQLHDQNGGRRGMILAGAIDDAGSLLTTAHPRLIVVHWSRHGGRYEELNRLLWARTVLAHRVPVIVIADRYRIVQATRLYRMGVTEYISRTHHRDQFAPILDAYLRHRLTSCSVWVGGAT